MSKQTTTNLNEKTWQLAAQRAGVKAVHAGLQLEDAPAETMRRAQNYVRRLRGITPAEKAIRTLDYAYWFLDAYLDNLYQVVWNEAPDCEAREGATDDEVKAALAADPYVVAWNARMDAIVTAQQETQAALLTAGAVGIASWCMEKVA